MYVSISTVETFVLNLSKSKCTNTNINTIKSFGLVVFNIINCFVFTVGSLRFLYTKVLFIITDDEITLFCLNCFFVSKIIFISHWQAQRLVALKRCFETFHQKTYNCAPMKSRTLMKNSKNNVQTLEIPKRKRCFIVRNGVYDIFGRKRPYFIRKITG